MFFIIGNSKFVKRGFVFVIIVGFIFYAAVEFVILVKVLVIIGIFVGIFIMFVMMVIFKFFGKRVYDLSYFIEEDRKVEKNMGIIKVILLWILLVVFILIINFIILIREFLYDKFLMLVEVMKGLKIKFIFIRVIW